MNQLFESSILILFVSLITFGLILLFYLQNLIRAVFAFFLILFGVAGIFALLGAGFVAVSHVIIYVGGILLLILFGVMLTHRGQSQIPNNPSINVFWGIGAAMIVFGGAILAFKDVKFLTNQPSEPPQTMVIKKIGIVFLTDHIITFELLSIFLLIAVIGAVYIARTSDNRL